MNATTTRLRSGIDAISSSLWFVPTLMAVAAVALSLGMVALDRSSGDPSGGMSWLYTGGAEGAREVLATIAASMIGVAGVSFSITVVALSLASQQLGPRLLRSFMRDRGNQLVLGTFVATFIYCVLVLRTVRGESVEQFVPHAAVTVGVVLGVASLGVLIYFIHHMSVLIQAPTVVASVAADLDRLIDRLFPERTGEMPSFSPAGADLEEISDARSEEVHSHDTGYVEAVDTDALCAVAAEHDLIVRVLRRPGDFAAEGSPVARVAPRERLTGSMRRDIADAITVTAQRTSACGVLFPLQQLVEVALRALSPSANDPFTAMACLDRIGAGIRRLACRRLPEACRCDDQGTLRVVSRPPGYAELVGVAFDQIRQAARDDTAVTVHLIGVLGDLGSCALDPELRRALVRQLVMVERGARTTIPEEWDRQEISLRFAIAHEALAARGRTGSLLSAAERGSTSPKRSRR